MNWVTKEQLERARQLSALEYIRRYEPDNLKPVGKEYRLRDHESLSVGENGWYRHSNGIGAWSALDYLTDVRGYGLVEAVCMLLNENPQERATMSVEKALPERPPFALPQRHKDNNRVIAYLQSRGIDRDLIMDCIERGVLFESKYYHNAVFLGKDEHGHTRFAAMRSTTNNFMRDADGSNKRYGFALPPSNPNSNAVAVFESPIDCLSHQTLCKHGYIQDFDGRRLSLGGTSILALEHFLNRRPDVTHCLICTDADEAGDMAAAKITAIPGITTERSPPIHGADWNEALMAIKKAERAQIKARDSPCI